MPAAAVSSRIYQYLLVSALCFLSACQGYYTPNETTVPERRQLSALEHEYAVFRKEQILDVDYQLAVQLDADGDSFSAQVSIDFVLAPGNQAPINIDFHSGKIRDVLVNGHVAEFSYREWFITLEAHQLQAGKNQVVIDYETKYSTQGEGLHRYRDQETGHVYLYTNFEPFSANKFFPHFDQPNLKARYTLQVAAPAQWQVISATRETSITEGDGFKHWTFPQTAKIPSYIFPLHAGDYHMWEDNSGSVPLRLFARKELASYVHPEEWFNYTHKSFAFFNDYFEFPYPFGKYDQVIVPEFNWGAMENLGAVTFSEKFITRGVRTEAEKISLASVIAHEMAHMWFGNITTMDWWNGLWLNESFATYMAFLAISRSEQVDGAWETFYSRIKQWAYTSDQEVTTHAIELPVNTTSEAFSNFDGITYGKGASVLKQLPHYLGEENFRRGVATYLKKHAYSNTTLEDFIGELGRASNKDLADWTQQWLFETGLNTLQARFDCSADGKWLHKLSLEQSAPAEYPTLREQTIQVGVFAIDPLTHHAVKLAAIPVTYGGASTTVPFAADTPCPDLIYPNLDDWGYVKIILDSKSQTTLMQHLAAFKDDSLRLMLWETLWEAVQDTRLPLTTYTDFAPELLAAETNSKVIERAAGTLSSSYEYFTALSNKNQDYSDQRERIESFFAQEILTRTNEADRQKLFFQRLIASTHTETRLEYLRKLLLKQEVVNGLTLDQDLRWQIILRLNQFHYRDHIKLTDAEAKADSSQRGSQSALAADAIRPDPAIKQAWLDRIFTQDSRYSLDQLRTVMQHLFPVEQFGLRAQFSEQVITRSSALDSATDDQTMKNISSYLAPNTCTEESAAQLEAVKDTLAELRPILGKNYRIAHHNNLRCLRVGELLLKQ